MFLPPFTSVIVVPEEASTMEHISYCCRAALVRLRPVDVESITDEETLLDLFDLYSEWKECNVEEYMYCVLMRMCIDRRLSSLGCHRLSDNVNSFMWVFVYIAALCVCVYSGFVCL